MTDHNILHDFRYDSPYSHSDSGSQAIAPSSGVLELVLSGLVDPDVLDTVIGGAYRDIDTAYGTGVLAWPEEVQFDSPDKLYFDAS